MSSNRSQINIKREITNSNSNNSNSNKTEETLLLSRLELEGMRPNRLSEWAIKGREDRTK